VEHLEEIGWVLLLVYLLLGLLVLIFHTHVEYGTALRICLGYAVLVTAVFGSIVLVNVIVIAVVKLIQHWRGKVK
jgi:hypothetical protein